MKETAKFITCECHGHGLYMDYYIQVGGEEDYPAELYMTPYGSRSYWEKPNFGWRLKAAWQVLRTGTNAGGEVVLSEDNAASIKAYIGNFLIKAEK